MGLRRQTEDRLLQPDKSTVDNNDLKMHKDIPDAHRYCDIKVPATSGKALPAWGQVLSLKESTANTNSTFMFMLR